MVRAWTSRNLPIITHPPQSLWHERHGNSARAHEIAQDIHTPAAAHLGPDRSVHHASGNPNPEGPIFR